MFGMIPTVRNVFTLADRNETISAATDIYLYRKLRDDGEFADEQKALAFFASAYDAITEYLDKNGRTSCSCSIDIAEPVPYPILVPNGFSDFSMDAISCWCDAEISVPEDMLSDTGSPEGKAILCELAATVLLNIPR